MRRSNQWLRKYFNPRSPHGERHVCPAKPRAFCAISTHAPRTGSDVTAGDAPADVQQISTHAPRTGSDGRKLVVQARLIDFNPRSPHGERRNSPYNENLCSCISTHAPRTGSDLHSPQFKLFGMGISTHAPRTGSDGCAGARCTVCSDFNPRSPHGERQRYQIKPGTHPAISTHAPRTGSDVATLWTSVDGGQFQPTLPARGATCG